MVAYLNTFCFLLSTMWQSRSQQEGTTGGRVWGWVRLQVPVRRLEEEEGLHCIAVGEDEGVNG